MTNTSSPGHSNTWAQDTWTRTGVRTLIDWVGFTLDDKVFEVHNVLELFQLLLGINKSVWQEGRKNYEGYADSFVYENINIYYNGAENQKIHVDITGQGCRYIDTIYQKLQIHSQNKLIDQSNTDYRCRSWKELFEELKCSGDAINFTRIDIAIDEFDGLIDVQTLFYKSLAGELKMKFKTWRPDGKFNSDGESSGISLYYGSDESRLQLNIYEKNKQLKLKDFHWTRLEIRYRKQRAEDLIKLILQRNPVMEIGYIGAATLKSYLNFLDKQSDSNKARWPISDFWSNFLEQVEPLKLASELPDRSIIRSRKWIDHQVSKTLAMMTLAYKDNNDDWMVEILKEGFQKLTEQDYRIIEEFRQKNEKKRAIDTHK